MKNNIFNTKTLKEQVYDYLREKIQKCEIKPGSTINLKTTSEKLGISRTPLRDALIKLEMEGFVSIEPRKGITVNPLTYEDIKNYYQIIGALESSVLINSSIKIKKNHIKKMENLNNKMKKAIENNNFNLYYENNLKFHNIYLKLSDNKELLTIVDAKKKRLYDFPRKKGFVKEWETSSIGEHQKIIDFIDKQNYKKAAKYLRDVHWSFDVQKNFILEYYKFDHE